MKQTAEKNMKQRSSYLPISIGLVLKIAVILIGYCVMGISVIWAFVGVYILYHLIRGILSCLITLGAIIALAIIFITLL